MKRFLDGLSPAIAAFLQAVVTISYIILLVLFIGNLEDFPEPAGETLLAPMFFLTLFVLSALTTGFCMLSYPVLLFLEGERSRAFSVVIWSAFWLLFALSAGFSVYYLFFL